MNKKFEAFFTDNGFTVNGNDAYGFVKGYETSVNLDLLDSVSPLRFHISFYATAEQKNKIAEEFKQLKIKFFKYEFTRHGVIIGLNGMTTGSILKNLPEIQDKIYSVISSSGALGKGFCACCGKEIDEENSKKCNINGFNITISNDCVNKENSAIMEENENFKNAPNNYLKGFVGALIGGIVGAVTSVIFYLLGFVSAISSIIAVLLGAFLYAKFGGKENKMMLVIVAITTIVCLVISHFATYIVTAGIVASEEGLAMNAFEAFSYVMKDAEVSGSFYLDLALIVVFALIGIGCEIYYLNRKIKRKTTI